MKITLSFNKLLFCNNYSPLQKDNVCANNMRIAFLTQKKTDKVLLSEINENVEMNEVNFRFTTQN